MTRPRNFIVVTAAALVASAAVGVTPAQAGAKAPTLTLDGGMFIKVGTILSTSDPDTATLPMNLTWSATNPGQQTAWLNVGQSDEGPFLDPQEVVLGPSARQATFVNYASEAVDDTTGGVFSDVVDDAYAYDTSYTEAEDLTLTGTWSGANCACWMGGDTMKGSNGAALAFTMGGNDYCDARGQTPGDIGATVAVIGDWASARGTARVLVDGNQVATVSEKKAGNTNRVVVWQKRYKGFTQATHKIRIVVASGRFDVDGLERAYAWDYKGCGG